MQGIRLGQRKQVRNFLLFDAAAAIGDGGSEAESISWMEKLLCMSTTKHNTRAKRVHNTNEQTEKGLNGKG